MPLSQIKMRGGSMFLRAAVNLARGHRNYHTGLCETRGAWWDSPIVYRLHEDAKTVPCHSTKFTEYEVEDILSLLIRLRSWGVKQNVEPLNQVIVHHFLATRNIGDLSSIFENRLEFGLFLDDYAGFHLLKRLTDLKEYGVAIRIVPLINYEHVNNELTKTMIIYTIYVCAIQEDLFQKLKLSEPFLKKMQQKSTTKYVGYFSSDNYKIQGEFEYAIGTILTKLTTRIKNNIELNMHALGLVLSKRYQEAIQLFDNSPQSIHNDVLKASIKFAQHHEPCDVQLCTYIENLLKQRELLSCGNFVKNFQFYVNEEIAKRSSNLMEEQNQIYSNWLLNFSTKLNEDICNQNTVSRLKNIENIYNELKLKEKHLWFFTQEDNYDLHIENMTQFYPKTWFGKKRKPKAVDSEYVPPDILKRK